VFDAGPSRVRKYKSVVIGSGTSVEVVSERTHSKLVGFASLFLVASQQKVHEVGVHDDTTCEG